MSGTITVMSSDRCIRRRRAFLLATNFSSVAAVRTFSASAGVTFDPLNTRETVAGDTPARAATS